MAAELGLFVAAVILYNAYVSWRVITDDAVSRRQKAAQLGIAWLTPLAGAILVHWVSLAQSRHRDSPSRAHAQYDDYQDPQGSPRMYDDS